MLNRSKFITLLVLVCVWPALAWGQQEMRSSTKGTSTPLPITGTAIDADHNALDVNILSESGGGPVSTLTIASGVTTNTTSSAVAGVTGTKTIWGEVVCSSGACAQTQAIYGARENGAANGLLLCTLTLSGTARAQDVCTGVTADYPYLYVITTNTSGTAAEGGTYVFP